MTTESPERVLDTAGKYSLCECYGRLSILHGPLDVSPRCVCHVGKREYVQKVWKQYKHQQQFLATPLPYGR
jgi:hypothetical protein